MKPQKDNKPIKHNKKTPKTHPSHKKLPITKNHKIMWIIGLIIFVFAVAIDNIIIAVIGGILAIYGVMNRHLWDVWHHK